jgi:glycosyltransferase involved in cell wall biosynthesis
VLNLAFAATNPCHLYPLAQALGALAKNVSYFSGYPKWKLRPPYPGDLHTHSFRTVMTYALLRLPEKYRFANRTLFLWQDQAFDGWVAGQLRSYDFIHGLPGQCLKTFRRAKELGIKAVLNHATGPSSHWIQVMRAEYERIGTDIKRMTVYDDIYLEREKEEYALADLHCVASTLVREQLMGIGIDRQKIWLVPYGVDRSVFWRKTGKDTGQFRIIFAGKLSLRKGVRTLLDALRAAGAEPWEVDFYGTIGPEVSTDLKEYRGVIPLHFHGAVPQSQLAQAMREASVLVLPSLEEGFGLVVAQALASGIPCIVSDRVGAKDLIEPGKNGSIFPVQDHIGLLHELRIWAEERRIVDGDFSWEKSARDLMGQSSRAVKSETGQI